jgi:hypothetical protein
LETCQPRRHPAFIGRIRGTNNGSEGALTGETLCFGEIAAAVMERSPASVFLMSGLQ